MKRVVQIFVDNERLDLFDDENIEYTSKIQDVRDIKMVFSDFTQTFTIPASDTNNKVFKHFYKTNITSNFFDARKKVDAEIFINHASFKRGKVFLNGVNMKMKKPSSYEIVFYSNLIKLKDLIGDDELSDLRYLDNFNHLYTELEVRNGLQTGKDFTIDSVTKTDAIIYPLITSKKRLFYNSSSSLTLQDNFDGNLYNKAQDTSSASDSDKFRGLVFTDLKPAIRIMQLIEAVEAQYNITFTRDFFGTVASPNPAFHNLYMWLSRNKDDINTYSTDASIETNRNELGKLFTFTKSTELLSGVNNSANIFTVTTDATSTQNFIVSLSLSSVSVASDEYILRAIDNDTNVTIVETRTKGTGTSIVFEIENGIIQTKNFRFEVVSGTALTISGSVVISINTGTNADTNDVTETYSFSSQSLLNNIVIRNQIPKMKVIDFLSGIFRMFNLTAFYIDDRSDADFDKIKVQTLDNFYATAVNNPSGGTIDITEFIDIRQHQVNVSLPFNEIEFKYEEPKTLLAEEHRERFNKVFGDAEFKLEDQFPNEFDRGTKYEIELPFSHFKYERLVDANNGNLTEIQWGYSAKGDFRFEEGIDADSDGDLSDAGDKAAKGNYEPVLTKPLLFYGINKTEITSKINYLIQGSNSSGLTSYFQPSNSNETGSSLQDPLETGTTTSTSDGKLVDSGQNFSSTLAVGDTVFNTTDNTQTTIKTVDSNTELTLVKDIFVSGETYKIFRQPAHYINFDNEVDEYLRVDFGIDANSLYNKFYKTYVESVFNRAKRLYKYNAYLPPSFMIRYKLNDQLKIQDKVYRINSINTNLTTGEASLELLNLTTDEQL